MRGVAALLRRGLETLRTEGVGAAVRKSIGALSGLRRPYLVYERDLTEAPGAARRADAMVVRSLEEARRLMGEGRRFEPLETRERLEAGFGAGATLFCAFDGNRLVHASWMTERPGSSPFDPLFRRMTEEGAAYIGPCATAESHRGAGLYPSMLRRICDYARERGLRRALINSAGENAASIRGIEKAGFRLLGRAMRVQALGREWWRLPRPRRSLRRIVWYNPETVASGGGERVLMEGLRCFGEMGIDARLVTFEYKPDAVFDGRYGARAEPCPSAGRLDRWRWLRRRFARLRPDLIVTAGTWGQTIHVFLATRGLGIPYAAKVYGSVFAASHDLTKYGVVFRGAFERVRGAVPAYRDATPAEPPAMSWLQRLRLEARAWAKWWTIRSASRLFVLSRRNGWEVRQLYDRRAVVLRGAFPRRIFDHRPSRDIRARLGLAGRPFFLTISRLVENKRVDLCIRGFAGVARSDPRAVLVVGGAGPEEAALRGLAASLELGERVRFIGHVGEDELWDHLASCDVFVHMDLADFDIAPLEALALGRKVVWAEEMERSAPLDRVAHIFAARPTPEDAARAMEAALRAELSGREAATREALGELTWESYFGAFVREMTRT